MLFITFSILFPHTVLAQQEPGSIHGTVRSYGNKAPIPSVTVAIEGTSAGTIANVKGAYSLVDLAPGSYVLKFSSIGYSTHLETEVVVRPGRVTMLDVELEPAANTSEAVVVTPSFFSNNSIGEVSAASFSNEEVRRTPGAGGDINRVLSALPSVVQKGDQSNELLVRGGSVYENGYYIDGMYIQNISHFPERGSSGGAISLLNLDFVESVDFYPGNFDAMYGSRMSSIMDLTFREGSRSGIEGQLDLNIVGFGGVLEGPLPDSSGSWLLSVKRSYLDLITDLIGTGAAPRYGDIHAKIVFDVDENNTLELLNIYGQNTVTSNYDDAIENDEDDTFEEADYQNTLGIAWRSMLSDHAFSETTLSWFRGESDKTHTWLDESTPYEHTERREHTVNLRHNTFLSVNRDIAFRVGVEARSETGEYVIQERLSDTTTAMSDYNLENERLSVSPFVVAELQVTPWLQVKPSMRLDWYSSQETFALSPRLSLRASLSENVSMFGAVGMYTQLMPLYFDAIVLGERNSDVLECISVSAGIEWLPASDTKVSLEAYSKKYSQFPMSPQYPYAFLGDPYADGVGGVQDIVFTGSSTVTGVELFAQKKFSGGLHGLVSLTAQENTFEDVLGIERPRHYDIGVAGSVLLGYRFSDGYEVSGRFNYSGGSRYSPFVEPLTGEQDASRYNEAQLPSYQSLNVRVDKRFFFDSSTLTAFLSVWNVYDRRNIQAYTFNGTELEAEEQFGLLPILGIEYEF